MLLAFGFGILVGIGLVGVAFDIRRALVPAQERDQQVVERFAKRDGR